MEQAGLPHQSFIHNEQDHLNPPKIPQLTLSKSDAHLSIPHLLMSQDESHPSLNRIVSGLFHVGSALPTPVSSFSNLQDMQHRSSSHQPQPVSKAAATAAPTPSSAALLSDPLQQPTLRKSSSAIDWSGAVIEATRKNSRPAYEWTPPGLGDKGSFSNLTSLQLQSLAHSHNHPAHTFAPPSNHPHEGGLVMSTTTDRSQQNMSSAMVAAPQQSFAQSLAGSSSTSSVPSAAQSAAATASAALDHSASVDKRPAQSGAFGGIFQRGFFSKPAMRSEEESYRYLMALDR